MRQQCLEFSICWSHVTPKNGPGDLSILSAEEWEWGPQSFGRPLMGCRVLEVNNNNNNNNNIHNEGAQYISQAYNVIQSVNEQHLINTIISCRRFSWSQLPYVIQSNTNFRCLRDDHLFWLRFVRNYRAHYDSTPSKIILADLKWKYNILATSNRFLQIWNQLYHTQAPLTTPSI